MDKEWIKLDFAVHPGEVLREYLIEARMTQKELANKVKINKTVINEIINGKRPITVKTAIKLEAAFSFKAKFWCNLQIIYEEAVERLKNRNIELISEISTLCYKTSDSSNISVITGKINRIYFFSMPNLIAA